jgi:hypothetical protein
MSGMAGLSSSSHNILHKYKEYNESGIYHQINPLTNILTTTTGLALPFVAIQTTPVMTPVMTPIYRPITNNKLTCSITQCEIDINTRYMSCAQCSNNYMEESIKNWFIHRSSRKSCPICRTNWLDFNVYINGQMNEEENVESIVEPMNEETYEAIGIRELEPPTNYSDVLQTRPTGSTGLPGYYNGLEYGLTAGQTGPPSWYNFN